MRILDTLLRTLYHGWPSLVPDTLRTTQVVHRGAPRIRRISRESDEGGTVRVRGAYDRA